MQTAIKLHLINASFVTKFSSFAQLWEGTFLRLILACLSHIITKKKSETIESWKDNCTKKP